jgi:hypothetical protein
MANDSFEFMKDVLAAPLGEIISSVGAGVGEAQASLDAGSLALSLELYSSEVGEDTDQLVELMRAIGYQPTFYSIPETIVKAKISLAISSQEVTTTNPALGANGQPKNKAVRLYASPNNASNTNRYNLNVAASTELEFKIVPVPPPVGVQNLRVMPDLRNQDLTLALGVLETLGITYQITNGEFETGDEVLTQSVDPGDVFDIDNTLDLTVG